MTPSAFCTGEPSDNATTTMCTVPYTDASRQEISGPAYELPSYIFAYVTLFNLIIFLIGVLGNAMVIVVVIKVKDMRTPMNYYLVNLSIADLLFLLICQPSALVEFFAKDRWYLGETICKLVPLLEHTVLHSSSLIIFAITCERYNAICRSFHKHLLCDKPRPIRAILVVWLGSVLTALPFFFMTELDDATFYDGSPCKVCTTKIQNAWNYWYIGSIFFVFFLLPLILLAVMYGKIIRKLYADSLKIEGQNDPSAFYCLRSRKQVVRMLIGIILLFFVSLLPLRIVILWKIFTPVSEVERLGPENYYNLMWFSRLMMYTNSAGNPIIYSLLSSKFKMAFKRVLKIYRPNDLRNSSSRYPSLTSARRTSVSARYSFLKATITNM